MTEADILRREIEREHEAISKTLHEIESNRDPMALETLLQELRQLLESHFAREEARDGLHASIGETAPNLLPQVEEVFAEHREIEVALRGLFERSIDLNLLANELQLGAAELAQRLRDHEARENDLFGHALYDVYGAGD